MTFDIDDLLKKESEQYVRNIIVKNKVTTDIKPFEPHHPFSLAEICEQIPRRSWRNYPPLWKEAPQHFRVSAANILKAARDDYQEHGYARNQMQDLKGNRCALGSIQYVSFTSSAILYYYVTNIMNQIAMERYSSHNDQSVRGIANVNDRIGREAVLDCFDTAIKEALATLEPQEPKDENW